MGVKVELNMANILKRLEIGKVTATEALTNEVIKDSNYYAPEDEGELKASAIKNSDYQNGKAIWDTPYARRLYYNPQYNFSKDKNPNAQGLWFEAAKAAKKEKWEGIAKKFFKEGFNG